MKSSTEVVPYKGVHFCGYCLYFCLSDVLSAASTLETAGRKAPCRLPRLSPHLLKEEEYGVIKTNFIFEHVIASDMVDNLRNNPDYISIFFCQQVS